MTANHQLLYHLAELMLAEQQHQLPVDRLFDDERIGEFVKSIQIDSPYQQMLLEGVFTESVKENNLHIAFSVEGYFHYALGEVIFHQAKGKGPEFLKDIIENNELNGSNEGVEQCLIRDVENNDLSRLMWLIDQGGEIRKICIKALASSLLMVEMPKIENKESYSKIELKQVIEKQFIDLVNIRILAILNELFADYTQDDKLVLQEVLKFLDKIQSEKIQLIQKELLLQLKDWASNERNELLELVINGYTLFDEITNKAILLSIENVVSDNESYDYYSSIGKCYSHIGEFEKAIKYFDKALKVANLPREDEIRIKGRIGSLYNSWSIKKYNRELSLKAIEFQTDALEMEKDRHGNQTELYATQLNNLAKSKFTFVMLQWEREFSDDEILNHFQDSFDIISKIQGRYTANIAGSLNNISMFYAKTGNNEKALEYALNSLQIAEKVYSKAHKNIALLLFNIGNRYELLENYNSALHFYNRSNYIDICLSSVGKNVDTIGAIQRCVHRLKLEAEKDYYIFLSDGFKYYEKYSKAYLDKFGEKHIKSINEFIPDFQSDEIEARYEALNRVYKASLDIFEQVEEKPDEDLHSINFGIAVTSFRLGNLSEAISILESTFEKDKKGGYPHYLGLIYEQINETEKALDLHIQAAELRKERLREYHPSTRESVENVIRLSNQFPNVSIPQWILDLNDR